jgi:selenocysteine lyase/cysteine desulfurase
MEKYFTKFRKNTIGNEQKFTTPYGEKTMVYADWVASGRLYGPIEKQMTKVIGPFVGNTHSESSETGTLMTKAYHLAHEKIKKHVNAGPNDVIITAGNGMTGVVNKLQRIIGLKVCGKISHRPCIGDAERPVVFITHMEHHSNHTSWFETMADLVVVEPGKDLTVDLKNLEKQLKKYKTRKVKIGSFTACSNVTGIETPYHQMAKMMHKYGGVCFVDFAASAPYVDIDMHPADPEEKLDAIMFSPHKFLGGPGTSGVLVFDSAMYHNAVPDQPGGGTVDWTNPWGEYKYISDIEVREDGGTPGFLQTIRTALCIELKNEMGVGNIRKREKQLVEKTFLKLSKVKGLHILADNIQDRLGVFSFYIENIHYNLLVKILNDRYGIQVRGGCACAGTYGHYLLDVSYNQSKAITEKINMGDLSSKPGWVRISLHPTMTDKELDLFIKAINEIVKNIGEWQKEYVYSSHNNEFKNKNVVDNIDKRVASWFKIS